MTTVTIGFNTFYKWLICGVHSYMLYMECMEVSKCPTKCYIEIKTQEPSKQERAVVIVAVSLVPKLDSDTF